ncbi:MAG: alanine dehydrogenase [Pseudomonadota bacterium]
MKIGVPTEVKNNEFRVGLTPESAAELIALGHDVMVQSGAGLGIGAEDALYRSVGAQILPDAAQVFAQSEMIVKVKEPQAPERAMLRPNHLLFTYLHLAPDAAQTRDLVASKAVCIAYETVTDHQGTLPLLRPMSQVAGRLSIQAGAATLQKSSGGRGVLLGGVPGVAPGKIVVIGGGVVGFHAAQMAVGMQAEVTIFDRNPHRIDELSAYFGPSARSLYATNARISEYVTQADLVVGAVLVPGASAPKLVSAQMVKAMKPGAVIVDVAIDQGGCVETAHATTHADPTYVVDDVVHYCVANMPGAVPRTSTYALNNATLPFVIALANKGWREATANDPHLYDGVNVWDGKVGCKAVADALDYEYQPA